MNLAVQEVQEAPEVCQEDQEEQQSGSSKKVNLGGDGELVISSSFVFGCNQSKADVPSLPSTRTQPVSTHVGQNAVLIQVKLGYGTSPLDAKGS